MTRGNDRDSGPGRSAWTAPSLRVERRLLREGHVLVAGMDEVGRGALAGPVTVGVVVVDARTRSAPVGVRDSKLLTPAARRALVPKLCRWAVAHAVGHAEPREIDLYGIIAALRLAARRALVALPALPGCVLLDGSHDWLTVPAPPPPTAAAAGQGELFEVVAARPVPELPTLCAPVIRTMVKADLTCAAVAAASVLAKVERDRIMVERAALYPGFAWELNKGYSAPEHARALGLLGPCAQHRRTWSLPGVREAAEEELGGPEITDAAPTEVVWLRQREPRKGAGQGAAAASSREVLP